MDFDEIIDRRGTNSDKWDGMQASYGVSPEDGISMWVADMDFRPPEPVQQVLEAMVAHGVYGYQGTDAALRAAVTWWMKTRHDWQIEPEWILNANGLVNGTALCVQAWTQPGDSVVLFTPVYHAFARVIKASGRRVVELPLVEVNGRMEMSFPESLPEGCKLAILCSPHNPGGQVWSREELQALARFVRQHDLILVSDEIHHDLVLPGSKHLPTALAAPEIADRLVTLTAATKSFNIAGAHIGQAIVSDPALRRQLQSVAMGLGTSPNAFGVAMATAAYSPGGAEWLDRLLPYLDANRQLLETAINAIPGARAIPLQSTYLVWADFSGTGMDEAALRKRIEGDARIAANHGGTFGTGGNGHMRFNIATPRARVEEAARRLTAAFADLQ